MMKVYIIFAIAGWAWALVVAAFLAISFWADMRTSRARGFEIIDSNEKQP